MAREQSGDAVNGPAFGVRRALEYAPSPVDNPLKGLVPYAGVWNDRFPHSLEFAYLPLSSLVLDYDRYDWTPLETLLNQCASRGHQAVFRVYVEYPGKTDGIPPFLLRQGMKVHTYRDTADGTPAANVTPDYQDPRLRRVLKGFIAALGRRYDGDPRLGFLTAGLLGHWGEWHTYPREELFARPDVQAEVMEAYAAAFRKTPVLLRYPVGRTTETKAANARRPFGYHDDSFAWSTLDTGRREDSWFFMASLKAAGPDALAKWKTHPIGGEIRPEAWGKVFDEPPTVPPIQDFRRCVQETHASWLMDSGLFRTKPSLARRRRAEIEVRRMGYELQVVSVRIGRPENRHLPVRVELTNHGVAPFYYDWPVEFALAATGAVKRTFRGSGKVNGLLPEVPPRQWNDRLDLRGVAPGAYRLVLRAANPLPNGHPLRFANRTQDADVDGWLTLAELTV
jgi:hypothetical protein